MCACVLSGLGTSQKLLKTGHRGASARPFELDAFAYALTTHAARGFCSGSNASFLMMPLSPASRRDRLPSAAIAGAIGPPPPLLSLRVENGRRPLIRCLKSTLLRRQPRCR